MIARNWLRTQADDESAPDWSLDHYRWGGFADNKFHGSEIAAEEALLDATKATGATFEGQMNDIDFQETVVEGEAWEDMEGGWLS